MSDISRPLLSSHRGTLQPGASVFSETADVQTPRFTRSRETPMKPMYLKDVEAHRGEGARADMIEQLRASGSPIPQIMHLFAYKPDRTDHLAAFTQGVMRGPSPLPPGQRELIAALTSKLNQCLF